MRISDWSSDVCSSDLIYVHAAAHDDFLNLLVRKASAAKLNNESIDGGHVGPLIFDRQADIIEAHIADAVAKGAKVETGGTLLRQGGVWCPPTVLSGVTHDMRSEEHTSELQSLMRISYAVFCLKKKNNEQT